MSVRSGADPRVNPHDLLDELESLDHLSGGGRESPDVGGEVGRNMVRVAFERGEARAWRCCGRGRAGDPVEERVQVLTLLPLSASCRWRTLPLVSWSTQSSRRIAGEGQDHLPVVGLPVVAPQQVGSAPQVGSVPGRAGCRRGRCDGRAHGVGRAGRRAWARHLVRSLTALTSMSSRPSTERRGRGLPWQRSGSGPPTCVPGAGVRAPTSQRVVIAWLACGTPPGRCRRCPSGALRPARRPIE